MHTGYPMVKEARHLVASGKLGKVRKVYVEYPQGWLSQPEEKQIINKLYGELIPNAQDLAVLQEISVRMLQTSQNTLPGVTLRSYASLIALLKTGCSMMMLLHF
jgi:hypothetical protein